MLMLRTFGTLLLGFATMVLGDKTLRSGPSVQVALQDTPVRGYILVDGKPKKYEAIPEIGWPGYSYTRSSRTARLGDEQTTARSPRQPSRRSKNPEDEGDDTGSALSVCQGRNSTTIPCPEETGCCVSQIEEAACCPAAGVTCDESDCVQSTASIPPTAVSTDLAIITVAQTSTSTVTSFAETRVVVVISTKLFTFLNPTQRTATSTVTVTSFLRKTKRAFGSPAEITASQTPHVSAPTSRLGPRITSIETRATAQKRQEATLTSTVVITTTILVPGITTRTLTNIVFSTTLAAPNAATTVFVTTTVFRPSTSLSPTDSTDSAEPTKPISTDPTSLTSTSPSIPIATTLSFPTNPSINVTPTPLPSSSSSPTEPETTLLPEETMMSLPPTTPTTTATATPIPSPFTPPQPTLTPAQIAALALGTILFLLLFIGLAFLLRRLAMKRRQEQAKMRQRLSSDIPPMSGAAPAPIVPAGSSSNGSSDISSGAYSGLTGEGEVRIVIRPAPRRRRTQSSGLGVGVMGAEVVGAEVVVGAGVVWPMPPNRPPNTAPQQPQGSRGRGRGYSVFMEEEEEGEGESTTTSLKKEKEWSIASERGSLGDDNNERRRRRREGGGSMLSTTSGYGYGYSTREESYPGLGTLLTPPPPPPLRLKERRELEQEREVEIRGFRTGLLGGRDTTTDGDSDSERGGSGSVPPVSQVVTKRPVTRGTEDSGNEADQESENGGGGKDSSPDSKKSTQSGNGGRAGPAGGGGTPLGKGSFGVGRAW